MAKKFFWSLATSIDEEDKLSFIKGRSKFKVSHITSLDIVDEFNKFSVVAVVRGYHNRLRISAGHATEDDARKWINENFK
jgi:hypothetical protein